MSDTRDTWERFGLSKADRRRFETHGIREGERYGAAWREARRRQEREARRRDWEREGVHFDNPLTRHEVLRG